MIGTHAGINGGGEARGRGVDGDNLLPDKVRGRIIVRSKVPALKPIRKGFGPEKVCEGGMSLEPLIRGQGFIKNVKIFASPLNRVKSRKVAGNLQEGITGRRSDTNSLKGEGWGGGAEHQVERVENWTHYVVLQAVALETSKKAPVPDCLV
jgi:hypothetical protein